MQKKFKLEKVLDFRNRKLDIEKAKMRELKNKEQNVFIRITETADIIKEKEIEMDSDNNNGIFQFANLYVKFIAIKEGELKMLENARNEILKQIEAQKIVLGKSLNDVKIIEKLKEKHLLNYVAYLGKQEMLMIDEVNITRRKNDERL